jgi:hypothetical protein
MKASAALAGGALVVALTVLSGVVQGWMTNRWGVPSRLAEAGAALERLPLRFGKWRAGDSAGLSDFVRNMLQAEGYLVRTYRHEPTGAVVNLLLLVGPPGPIGVHTPEVCFSGQGYSLLRKRQAVELTASDQTQHGLWVTTFRNSDLSAQSIRIYYGWTAGGSWTAAKDPRMDYAGSPYLYKVQVSTQVPAGRLASPDDTARSFLEDLFPVVTPLLLPTDDDSSLVAKD